MRSSLLVAALMSMACGPSDPETADAGGGAGGTGGGTSQGGGTGGTGTGGGAASSDAGRAGYVSLTQTCTAISTGEVCTATANAFFTALTDLPVATHCTLTTVGGCQVSTCTSDGGFTLVLPDGGLPQRIREHSAGTIRVSGTRLDGGSINLPWRADGGYESLFTVGRMWTGGETLTVTASGGEVPAFTQPLPAPAAIAVTSPVCTAFGCPPVSRSAPMTVTWSGGPANVFASFGSYRLGHWVSVTCNFTTSPGVVDAAAMAMLGASDAGYANAVNISVVGSTPFRTGDYDILLGASSTQLSSNFDTTN